MLFCSCLMFDFKCVVLHGWGKQTNRMVKCKFTWCVCEAARKCNSRTLDIKKNLVFILRYEHIGLEWAAPLNRLGLCRSMSLWFYPFNKDACPFNNIWVIDSRPTRPLATSADSEQKPMKSTKLDRFVCFVCNLWFQYHIYFMYILDSIAQWARTLVCVGCWSQEYHTITWSTSTV